MPSGAGSFLRTCGIACWLDTQKASEATVKTILYCETFSNFETSRITTLRYGTDP